MNPILLKPTGNGESQVVVNGRVWKTLSAREYYGHADVLRIKVLDAYNDLASRFDAVVIEGAGSVSELNLRHHDLVNLGLVTGIRAPWLLVADIERGGVFASVIGTVGLLSADERSLFRGFAINKFRGDLSLFDEGVTLLEERTAAPCLGVFPHATEFYLDAEDSLALDTRARRAAPAGGRIAIVRFPHLSNSTDFRLLTWADWLTSSPVDQYDAIILPGTKDTIADLLWLRSVGLDKWIRLQHRAGAKVVGICGGYQMLGKSVHDPDGVESNLSAAEGLALLPVTTTLTNEKRTRAVSAKTRGGVVFGGYEIHMGVTVAEEGQTSAPFATLEDGEYDGACRAGVVGTYLHGALEHSEVCAEVFGIPMPSAVSKASEYARLAAWFEQHGRHLDCLGFN